jgi:uncharacterized membrane protein
MTFRLKMLRRSPQPPKQAILKNTSRQNFEKSSAAKENAASRSRLNSIDFLRGLVMIVMALDHTRDFFAAGGFNPRDVTEPALFLTRWITHFCAPAFVFLAGVSAFLYGTERKTSEISRYLFTRGCWLVLIEFSVVRFGWTFSFKIDYLVIQVIFVIGASMIVLAAHSDEPKHALSLVQYLRTIGYKAWVEDINGNEIEETALKMAIKSFCD